MKKSSILFLLLIIWGCKTTITIRQTETNTSNQDYLLFKVIAFEDDALHFDYEPDGGQWFSGTKVELINYQLNKQEFWIYHGDQLEETSEWRKINSIIKCTYSEQVLNSLINDWHFFSSQLEIIQE